MALTRAPADHPTVWAVPISSESVALWCELPPAASEVSLTLDGVAFEPLLKRRLISRGRRIHLFLFRTTNFKAAGSCAVSYRPDRSGAMAHFRTSPNLAEWRSSSVTAVVHAIVEALAAGDKGAADMRMLARFLNLTASWAPARRYCGTEGRLSVAVFEFVPRVREPISVVAVGAGSLALQRVVPVPLGTDGCCLLWHGDLFDRAYVEHEGELLELNLAARHADEKPLPAWFAELAADQQDAVLDGLAMIPPLPGAPDQGTLGRLLPQGRDYCLGHATITVKAAFTLNAKVCVLLKDTDDVDLSVTVSRRGQDDSSIATRVSSFGQPGDPATTLFSAGMDFGSELADGGPVRVTLGSAGLTGAHWLPVQGMENSRGRRRIRKLIDWQCADENVVREVAEIFAAVSAVPAESPPPVTALTTIEARDDAALLICRYAGDLPALRSTLIAMRLTSEDVAVRLVSCTRPSVREVLDLRELAQSVGLAVSLVTLGEGVPFSDAVRVQARTGVRQTMLLAESGIVPLDRDWWHRVAAMLDQNPTLLCYGFADPQPSVETSALSLLRRSPPLLIAGARIDQAVLPGVLEFQTFEGTIHHALAAAQRAGCAEHLPWLRLLASTTPSSGSPIGAVRLDDAVAAAALRRPTPGDSGRVSNLVQLAVRELELIESR